jgi:hypothetical protein
VGTDDGDSAGAVTRGTKHWEETLVVVLTCRCGLKRASRIREGGAALTQPLNGTDLLPPMGAPAARDVRACRLALAFGEKAHRSIIISPLVHCAARNGCDLSVLLKYKDLYFGGPSPLHSIHEAQQQDDRYRTLARNLDKPRLSGDSSLVSHPDEFDTFSSTEFVGTRKQRKSTTDILSRNGTDSRKPRYDLGFRPLGGL